MIRPVVHVEVLRDGPNGGHIGVQSVPVPTLEEYRELVERVEQLELRLAKICHPTGMGVF